MADRSSAEIFGMMFEYLAEQADQRAKDMAHAMWDRTGNYDFNEYQMYCDDALQKLGLAKKCTKCNYLVYHNRDHDSECEDNVR